MGNPEQNHNLPPGVIEPYPDEVRIDALVGITHAVETAANLDELLLLSLHEITHLLGVARSGVLLLRDDGAGQVVCEYPPRIDSSMIVHIADIPAIQRAISKREAVQVDSSARTGIHARAWDLLRAQDVDSALLVPLISQDTVLGVIGLAVIGETRVFKPGEIGLARVLASQMATAIAFFRQHNAARRRNDELNTLNEIASTITSTLDTREVYRLVVQKLSAYFQVEAGSLLLLDEPSGDLEFVMTIEGGEEKLAGVRVPMGRGVVGHVVQSRHWEIVHDVQRDSRFYSKVSEDIGFVTRSILCVPMIAKGRVIGAVELLNKVDGHFEEDEAERLMRMAAFIGVAIENARLFQQIADGRDRLEAILNSTADGILMADMHGFVLLANPMAATVVESPEEQLIGCSLDDILHELHVRAHEISTHPWNVEGDSAEQEPIYELELRGTQHRFVRQLTLPVHDAGGEVYGRLAVLRDITQEKELQQLRDDYTSMLVHDLRAPLTSIMNGIMMVKRGMGGPVSDSQDELLQIAYQGSQALLALVNNLLDISKMEQGQLTLERKPLAPLAVIDQALERLTGSVQTHQLEIEQRLAVSLPLIEADEDKIVRVLQNLIDNAIKYAPTGSPITVGAHVVAAGSLLPADLPLHAILPDGHWLVVWVQDRGMGIPAKYHERIFEKFGQVRGRKLRGTGLGLTFCKLAIEAHQGKIWVESAEGEGSVFAFALPITNTAY